MKWCEGNKEIEELVLHNWYRVSYRSGNSATTYKRLSAGTRDYFQKEIESKFNWNGRVSDVLLK